MGKFAFAVLGARNCICNPYCIMCRLEIGIRNEETAKYKEENGSGVFQTNSSAAELRNEISCIFFNITNRGFRRAHE